MQQPKFTDAQQQMLAATASDLLQSARMSQMTGGTFDSNPTGTQSVSSNAFLDELAKIPNTLQLGEPIKALVKERDALSRMESIQASGTIVFGNGVPVGGWTAISLFPNGAFNFSGHLHVSGAPSYDIGVTWVVSTRDGQPTFSLPIQGRCHGTFEAGSRDFDWNVSGSNPALAAAWAELSAGYKWAWHAGANIDINSITGAAVQAVGAVGTVIALL